VVVAQTRAQAMDAADAVAVDYEPLPPVIDPEAALEPDAPILFEAHGSNLAIRVDDVAEDRGALEDAETVVRARFVNQRVAPVPMEPNGALAIAGATPGQPSVTLWASVQAPHDTRRVVAQVCWGWTPPRCASAPRRWAAGSAGRSRRTPNTS